MGAMDEATFADLQSPEGELLLARVAELAPALDDLALGTRLRRDHDPALVAAAVSQYRLRHKATAKFGALAHRLWFTPDALEQSTRRAVAEHRAKRLVALGATSVVDLGCGIGGDLLAMARHGLSVRGVEADPLRAALARANLAAAGVRGTVEVADALRVELGPDEVAFVDPARRDGRGRVFTLDGLQPPWDFVVELLRGRAVAKVMPGIAHEAIPAGVDAEWVSEGGALVEACLWGEEFETGAARRATVLPSGTSIEHRGVRAALGPVRAFLVEPDDAVIRAGLVAEFAEQIGGTLIDPHIAWVTTDNAPNGDDAHLGRWFRVDAEVPFHTKHLKAALVTRDIGTLTVKKRGVDIVPEQLIARLKLRGRITGTLIMTRVDGTGRAYLAEPWGVSD